MVLKMKNWNILGGSLKNPIFWGGSQKTIIGGSLKNPIFRGGGHKKPIYREELPKKGGLGQFANLRGVGGEGLAKKRGWCF